MTGAAKVIRQSSKFYKSDVMRTCYGRHGDCRCAVAGFGAPPFIRHAPVGVPLGVAHSRPLAGTSLRSCAHSLRSLRGFPPKRCAFLRRIWRPIKQASRLRSRLALPIADQSAGKGRDALSRDARKGGMAFGAHEPPRTRRRLRPCRANPHCGGAPTNAALKGGFPESASLPKRRTEQNLALFKRVWFCGAVGHLMRRM